MAVVVAVVGAIFVGIAREDVIVTRRYLSVRHKLP